MIEPVFVSVVVGLMDLGPFSPVTVLVTE